MRAPRSSEETPGEENRQKQRGIANGCLDGEDARMDAERGGRGRATRRTDERHLSDPPPGTPPASRPRLSC